MKKIILIILLLFSLSQIFVRSFFINYYEETSGAQPDLFYLPDTRYIKPLVLSYSNFAADLVFIKTIGYFADQFLGVKDYKYLEKLLYITAGLDSLFEKAYIWGGSILMYNGNWITRDRVMASSRFLEYGWHNIKNQEMNYKHDKEYWRIPQMIGFNYAIELKEPEKGIPYIEEVARIPGTPSFYRTWVSTLLKKSGDTKKALASLERELIIENLKTALSQNIDQDLKNQILNRLRKYYRELYDEKYADEKIKELDSESKRIESLYSRNFPYLSKELFFAMDADEILEREKENLVDKLYFE